MVLVGTPGQYFVVSNKPFEASYHKLLSCISLDRAPAPARFVCRRMKILVHNTIHSTRFVPQRSRSASILFGLHSHYCPDLVWTMIRYSNQGSHSAMKVCLIYTVRSTLPTYRARVRSVVAMSAQKIRIRSNVLPSCTLHKVVHTYGTSIKVSE